MRKSPQPDPLTDGVEGPAKILPHPSSEAHSLRVWSEQGIRAWTQVRFSKISKLSKVLILQKLRVKNRRAHRSMIDLSRISPKSPFVAG